MKVVGFNSKPRKLSQTYLVFPEWFIVYATDDLAKICKATYPSNFPYFLSIFQFWYAYIKVSMLTRKMTFNFQYHIMLIIIGISFSMEMLIKGLYEKTIGRISWFLSGKKSTLEDQFLAEMTEEYGRFMHTIPWYKFDFPKWKHKLTGVVNTTFFRSNERRLFIKTDLWIKTIYARIIGKGVQTPDELTLEAVITDNQKMPRIISIPRYQDFDNFINQFPPKYENFLEIAGNKVICLSIITEGRAILPNYVKRLYSLTLLTNANYQRVVIELNVEKLIEFVEFTKHREIKIEKIYDY